MRSKWNLYISCNNKMTKLILLDSLPQEKKCVFVIIFCCWRYYPKASVVYIDKKQSCLLYMTKSSQFDSVPFMDQIEIMSILAFGSIWVKLAVPVSTLLGPYSPQLPISLSHCLQVSHCHNTSKKQHNHNSSNVIDVWCGCSKKDL